MTTQTEAFASPKDAALKLALEALTATMSTHGFRDAIDEAHDKAITAIKEALMSFQDGAQPAVASEQEPVEWGVDWGPDGNSVSIIKRLAGGGIEVVGWEYAPHPPQRSSSATPRKPLTDEQRNEIARQADENDWHDYDIIDAVEAAHGITASEAEDSAKGDA